MPNEKFKKFLEFEAERNPLKISEERISWEEQGERETSTQPSDFLESVYLGKKLQSTVVMERSVAAMLQHQLATLEKENEHLRKTIKILKIVLSTAAVAVMLLLWALLSLPH